MTWSDKIESSVGCRAHAERLRKLAKAVTTAGLRKTLMDAAADYDKLARQIERGIETEAASASPGFAAMARGESQRLGD